MQKTIMIVEDEPANQKLFSDLLNNLGYRILLAKNGLEAIDFTLKEIPDLILMDIGLPGISGLDATKIIKENHKTRQVPIIAVTAFAMKEDETRAIQAGCDSFITKPVNIKDLIKEIERWISNSDTSNVLEIKGGICNG